MYRESAREELPPLKKKNWKFLWCAMFGHDWNLIYIDPMFDNDTNKSISHRVRLKGCVQTCLRCNEYWDDRDSKILLLPYLTENSDIKSFDVVYNKQAQEIEELKKRNAQLEKMIDRVGKLEESFSALPKLEFPKLELPPLSELLNYSHRDKIVLAQKMLNPKSTKSKPVVRVERVTTTQRTINKQGFFAEEIEEFKKDIEEFKNELRKK